MNKQDHTNLTEDDAPKVVMKGRSVGVSELMTNDETRPEMGTQATRSKPLQHGTVDKGGINAPPTTPRPKGGVGATKPKTPTGPIRFTLGEVMLVQGLRMELTYVNPGRKRLTFTVLDEGVRLVEPVDRDPVVAVDGVAVSGR